MFCLHAWVSITLKRRPPELVKLTPGSGKLTYTCTMQGKLKFTKRPTIGLILKLTMSWCYAWLCIFFFQFLFGCLPAFLAVFLCVNQCKLFCSDCLFLCLFASIGLKKWIFKNLHCRMQHKAQTNTQISMPVVVGCGLIIDSDGKGTCTCMAFFRVTGRTGGDMVLYMAFEQQCLTLADPMLVLKIGSTLI